MRTNVCSFMLFLILAVGCGEDHKRDQVINYVAPSPDGLLEASIIEEGFGATVSDVYSVRIRKNKEDSFEILKADDVRDLKVHWLDKKNLEINLSCGRIFKFTNFFDVMSNDGNRLYVINIKLQNTSICKKN